jgi:transcriptional regulator with XRE-family HTH domain
MKVITGKIKSIQEQKNLSLKKLAKLADYEHGGLSKMINAKASFPKAVIKRLLPILEISGEEFESWILADKYPKEILKPAIQNKKDFPYKRKSILTTKIDSILQQTGMSRTALSKEIKYSQSGLNRMITGQINMSDSVRERIAAIFEISQDEILSWIVADKYSLQILEMALLEN